MTVSYSVGFDPIWYTADLIGKPAAGAQLFTYSSLNPTLPKATYFDDGGNFPQPNPITADENGTWGPIYFSTDPSLPLDNYYLVVQDKDGIPLWSFNNYIPGSSSGGGSSTNFIYATNFIANNIMLNNISTTNLSSTIYQVIAPSNHQRFVPTGTVGPDMLFCKNVTTATDSISFPNFPAALNPLSPDVTPPFYAEYVSNGTTGEVEKFFQWPVCHGVKNLAGQAMTFSCWVQSGTGTTSNVISCSFRQYFGSGGTPSPDIVTNISGSVTISPGWQKLVYSFTVPTISGTTIGDCEDDATYIQINMPINTSADVCFTKPCLFLGTVNPTTTFDTYDQIDSLTISGYRSGDFRQSINTTAVGGWVSANNGTIGNTNSNATTRSNGDTFPLFNYIWHAMFSSQNYAPMYSSSGAAVSYGSSAVADFSADNQISLTKTLGQVLAGTASIITSNQTFTVDTGVSTSNLIVSNAAAFGTGSPVSVSNSGGALPTGLSAGVIYYSVFVSHTIMRLATSIANAIGGNVLAFSTNGSGTNTIAMSVSAVGSAVGENAHLLVESELPNPLASGLGVGSGIGGFNEFIISNNALGGGLILNPNGNHAHNNIQPTTFMNVFLKL